VFAPLAVNTEVAPLHIAAGLAVAVTVGNGLTVTLTVAVPEHPAVLVPVTVYVVVALGVTVLLAPLPNPPDQLYVFAPLAVNTEVAPLHIAAGLADAVTDGNGFTVTLTVAVPVHPAVLVPVTEYVVVVLGVTVLLAPLPNPPDQLYVFAPLAVITEVCPLHIAAGLAVAVTVGNGFTVTLTAAVPVHPAVLVPVTVYVVVVLGVTVLLAPLPNPPDQLYVFAPLAVITEVCPLHIAAGLAVAVTVGNGFTVTLTAAVPVHPAVLVPVTVYVVVALGVTVLLAPLPNPPDQLYVFAPLAVITEVCPLHIAAGLAVAATDGNGFTVTLTVAVPVHPAVVVPVTVYVVVLVGDTVLELPVPRLCDQL
jgi:hypothetical protein